MMFVAMVSAMMLSLIWFSYFPQRQFRLHQHPTVCYELFQETPFWAHFWSYCTVNSLHGQRAQDPHIQLVFYNRQRKKKQHQQQNLMKRWRKIEKKITYRTNRGCEPIKLSQRIALNWRNKNRTTWTFYFDNIVRLHPLPPPPTSPIFGDAWETWTFVIVHFLFGFL